MEINGISHGVVPTTNSAESEDAALRKACREFESIFTAYMLKKMRDTVPKSDFFGSDRKEEIFQSMLDDEVAKEIAQSGAMRLGDLMYAQLSGQSKNRSSFPEESR